MSVALAVPEDQPVPTRAETENRVLRHELAEMTSDRDHWRRYAGSLEARLEALGYVIPPDEETTQDYTASERAALDGDTRC